MSQSKGAWIKILDASEEDPALQEVYEQFGIAPDKVDGILSIHSLSAASLRGHMELYRALMFGQSPLKRAEREMIAVTVSTLNECHY